VTLQASGAISFSDLRTEYGDAGASSMSEHYKGGALVPSSITEYVIGAYGSALFTIWKYMAHRTYITGVHPVYNKLEWYWGSKVGTEYYVPYNSGFTSLSVINGWRYTTGSQQYYENEGSGNHRYDYQIRRRSEGNQSVSVNPNVPTAGQISLSDFYGGRKT